MSDIVATNIKLIIGHKYSAIDKETGVSGLVLVIRESNSNEYKEQWGNEHFESRDPRLIYFYEVSTD